MRLKPLSLRGWTWLFGGTLCTLGWGGVALLVGQACADLWL